MLPAMITRRATVAGLSLLGTVGAAKAQTFYQGKTITLISGASGGYEAYARLIAAHLGKYLPGNPNVVVKPMPGAASMAAANYLFNTAPRDGLTIGSFVRAIPLAPLLGDSAARYDPTKFLWLGTASSYRDDAYLLIVRKDSDVRGIDDLLRRQQPLRLGSTGPSSEADVGARVIGRALGVPFKLVRGYQGTPNIALAVEQGEMDGMMIGMSSLGTARPQWLQPNSPVRFLLQFGFGGDGRHPQFSDVMRVDELATSAEQKALLALMQLPFKLARPFAAPPNVPVARATILVKAFAQAQLDTDYRTEAARQGLDVSPLGSKEVADLIQSALELPPALIRKYRDLLDE